MAGSVAIAVLCIPIAGIAAQWLAWRMHLPAIVLLFVVGLLLGPGLQILRPAQDFGYAMRPPVGLAVAIVVFEGGLALIARVPLEVPDPVAGPDGSLTRCWQVGQDTV